MLDINLYMELRSAGYTVDQINAYASTLENPTQPPAPASAPNPAPASAPNPAPAPAPNPAPAPAPNPTPAPNDLLQTILDAIQNQNINRQQMQQDEVTAEQVLANIINPKGHTPTK